MTKVITYGTYDLLHYGHIRLLKRAKALGDYLIVGVTGDDFDKARGKINVQQSLMERIEAVRATGLADKIIVEEYEGQKINDIWKYDIDIFTVGSDWKGKFDYLKEYCKVVYLDRTEGISSSEIREEKQLLKMGLVGDALFLNKVFWESNYVNGLCVSALFTANAEKMDSKLIKHTVKTYSDLLEKVDVVYIRSVPDLHYEQIKMALEKEKSVLCESPLTLDERDTEELLELAKKKNLILMEAIKTAYTTAFTRLLFLIKEGKIGQVISVDATCTSLRRERTDWSGIYEWGPTALLPIFEILGTDLKKEEITICLDENEKDIFAKVEFVFDHAVASAKVGDGVKAEGELIIAGTKGYAYVPAPWWKMDYFELRYENQEENKRYFYQLDGEGIRYELVAFARAVKFKKNIPNIKYKTTKKISKIMHKCSKKENCNLIYRENNYVGVKK